MSGWKSSCPCIQCVKTLPGNHHMLMLRKTLFIRKSIWIILAIRWVKRGYKNAPQASAEDIIWQQASFSLQLKGYFNPYRIWNNCDRWLVPEHVLFKCFSSSFPLPPHFLFSLWSKFMHISYGLILKCCFYLFTFWKSYSKKFYFPDWYLESL